MIGNAIKCDECGKIDLVPENRGANSELQIKWFRVTQPQYLKPNESILTADICSLNCLQDYAQGWTA